MTQANRPDWIHKASKEVSDLYQRGVQNAEHAKSTVQASEEQLKNRAHASEEHIADIIHKHFNAHKS
jgi:hypothetical protein